MNNEKWMGELTGPVTSTNVCHDAV